MEDGRGRQRRFVCGQVPSVESASCGTFVKKKLVQEAVRQDTRSLRLGANPRNRETEVKNYIIPQYKLVGVFTVHVKRQAEDRYKPVAN